jgi:hypothetical protein
LALGRHAPPAWLPTKVRKVAPARDAPRRFGWTSKGPADGQHPQLCCTDHPPEVVQAVEGEPIAVSAFGAAFPDTSVPMGGWRLSGMPFAEIGITGATVRTVMSRCGELERTSRGCYRAQTRRANADAV